MSASRKRLPVWRTLVVMASDAAAIGVGLIGAYWLRFHSPMTGWTAVTKGYEPEWYLRVLPLAWVVWLLALRFENLYRRRSRVLDFNVVRRIVTGSGLALLILLAINFYFRPAAEYSRLVTLIMVAVGIVALIANRILLHFLFRWMLVQKGMGQARTAILGAGPLVGRIYETLRNNPEKGMLPVGVILGGNHSSTGIPGGLPILGHSDSLEAILAEHRIDEVILAEPGLERENIPSLLIACERGMAVFRIVPEVNDLLMSGMVVETLDGIPLLGIRETPIQGWNAALKRFVDFSAALVGLILLAPLIAFLAWRVWRQDRYNPFFSQERMGIDGRLFRIIKLRTMAPDAEVQTGPTFADDRDTRCTPLGEVLRHFHLDELPQLLNVLRGEMSLVGPRPERPYFIEQFREDLPRYMARHKVKSGITGWAQINGLCGRHGSIAERLKYDLYYIENWSLWLDFKIIFATVFGQQRPGPVR